MFSFGYPMEDQYYDAPIPRISIPRLPDGLITSFPLSEPELSEMTGIPCLVNYMDGTPSPDRSEFWLGYNDEGLIIAGRLHAPDHGRTDVVESQRKHEQIRIILNPTPELMRGFRIRLRPDGIVDMIAEGEDTPEEWLGERVKVDQEFGDDGWSFLARIPFGAMGVDPPSSGEIWKMNLFRHELKRQEDNSSWSIMYLGRSDIPARYGEIVFEEGVCAGLSVCETRPGFGRCSFEINNPGGEESSVSIQVRLNDELVAEDERKISQGRCKIEAGFPLDDGGEIVAGVLGEEGELLSLWTFFTSFPRLMPRIELLLGQLDQMSPSSPKIVRDLEKLVTRVVALKEELTRVATEENWQALNKEARSIERQSSIIGKRLTLSDQESPAALLGTSGLVKILPDLPLPDVFEDHLELECPRNASDSGQVLVLAFDGDLKDCGVTVSVLEGPHGSPAEPGWFEIRKVGYVKTRKPRYLVEHVGRHPDPLLPLEPFDVESGSADMIWITVDVPSDAAAGLHKFEVEVKPRGRKAMVLPMDLTVWDFELPVRSTLRTAFPMFEREIEEFYGSPVSRGQRRSFYDFLLKRRISPSCQYEQEPRPRKEDLEEVMSGGSNVISLGYVEEGNLKDWFESVVDFVDLLRERGWMRYGYVYGFDEVTPDGYERLKGVYGEIKRTYPELPRACTIGPEHELSGILGTVDIWIPQTDRYEDIYRERRDAGDEIWWYVSMWPRHPFANMFVDYPAIDHRILFWQCWKYGVTGFLYYCINLWSSNCMGEPSLEREVAALPDAEDRKAVDGGARWPNVRWNTYTGPTAVNGDGQLIYPGPDGWPLSSIRLECVRHGIEDYEMLAMLKAAVEKAGKDLPLEEAHELLEVPDPLVRSLTEFTSDPKDLLEVRHRLGQVLETLARG